MSYATRRTSIRATVALAAVFLWILGMVAQTNTAKSNVRLTKREVKALVANAKTPEDHMKLARHFRQEADRLEAEAKDHDELAQEYRKNPSAMAMKMPMSPRSAEHCEYFAKSAREAAKAARELADSHEQMAKEVRQPSK